MRVIKIKCFILILVNIYTFEYANAAVAKWTLINEIDETLLAMTKAQEFIPGTMQDSLKFMNRILALQQNSELPVREARIQHSFSSSPFVQKVFSQVNNTNADAFTMAFAGKDSKPIIVTFFLWDRIQMNFAIHDIHSRDSQRAYLSSLLAHELEGNVVRISEDLANPGGRDFMGKAVREATEINAFKIGIQYVQSALEKQKELNLKPEEIGTLEIVRENDLQLLSSWNSECAAELAKLIK